MAECQLCALEPVVLTTNQRFSDVVLGHRLCVFDGRKIVGLGGTILTFAPHDSIWLRTPRFLWKDNPSIRRPSSETQLPGTGLQTRNGSTDDANADPFMLPRSSSAATCASFPRLQRLLGCLPQFSGTLPTTLSPFGPQTRVRGKTKLILLSSTKISSGAR